MISDQEVMEAVRYDGQSALSMGAAVERAMLASAKLKRVKAQQMSRHPDLALSAQEREAYASKAYHLAAVEEAKAVAALEELKASRAHARLCIEIWKTVEASHRVISRHP
jgi:TfoX/Sxy family transcriptional regulator of competence genes